jgi:hypothetical protein
MRCAVDLPQASLEDLAGLGHATHPEEPRAQFGVRLRMTRLLLRALPQRLLFPIIVSTHG